MSEIHCKTHGLIEPNKEGNCPECAWLEWASKLEDNEQGFPGVYTLVKRYKRNQGKGV